MSRYGTESGEQIALFEWIRFNQGSCPELELAFHVPNGGWRHPATAATFRALGVRPGVPDVWLPVPRGGYTGLVLELKSPTGKGRVRPEQDAWLKALRAEKWATLVATQWEAAANAIALYLRGEWKEQEVA